MSYATATKSRAVSTRDAPDAPALDAAEFNELSEMIGEDGVAEMVMIFENETRQRLRRLIAGEPDIATLMREMHTLKGAAGTVACPRLIALGLRFEQAARRSVMPSTAELRSIEAALDAFLAEVRTRVASA